MTAFEFYGEILGEATPGPVEHLVHVKKEEPEDEDDPCKTPGSVRVQIRV